MAVQLAITDHSLLTLQIIYVPSAYQQPEVIDAKLKNECEMGNQHPYCLTASLMLYTGH